MTQKEYWNSGEYQYKKLAEETQWLSSTVVLKRLPKKYSGYRTQARSLERRKEDGEVKV